jgi:hypothetical protein
MERLHVAVDLGQLQDIPERLRIPLGVERRPPVRGREHEVVDTVVCRTAPMVEQLRGQMRRDRDGPPPGVRLR